MKNTYVLNCCSCGGGLSKPINNLVKCSYCGNYNKILPDGNTLIYKSEDNFKKSNSETTKLTTNQLIACVLLGCLFPYIMRKSSFRKR
jgi:hypothetical protein